VTTGTEIRFVSIRVDVYSTVTSGYQTRISVRRRDRPQVCGEPAIIIERLCASFPTKIVHLEVVSTSQVRCKEHIPRSLSIYTGFAWQFFAQNASKDANYTLRTGHVVQPGRSKVVNLDGSQLPNDGCPRKRRNMTYLGLARRSLYNWDIRTASSNLAGCRNTWIRISARSSIPIGFSCTRFF
jgi:hypothetical protein